jgi:hypothetical protein
MRARLGAKTFKCTEIMSCMWYSCRGGVGTCVTSRPGGHMYLLGGSEAVETCSAGSV